jgi:hypothetical protein
MRSTTTTIETTIPADRLAEVFGVAAAGASGVLAVSEDGPTGAVGTASSATGVLTGAAVAAAAAGFDAGFRGRADDCVR